MNVKTTIIVEVTKANGEVVKLERTTLTHHGSNPSFERTETAEAARVGLAQFIEANTLMGTRPL